MSLDKQLYTHAKYNSVRANFRRYKFKIDKQSSGVNHSHNYQAGLRSSADMLINEFIRDQRLVVYAIQKSSRDVQMGYFGSLDHYMPMDAHTRGVKTDNIPKNVMFKLINVDYYIDWLDYLWMDAPFILFTATPSEVVGCDHDLKWTVSNNKLQMSVNGGAVYQHLLWDYSIDIITAQYPGIGIHYYVDVVRVDKHWSVCLLTPYHRFKSTVVVPELSLRRRDISHKVRTFMHPDKLVETLVMFDDAHSATMQIAMPGEFDSIKLTKDMVSYLRSSALSRKMEPQNIFTSMVNVYGVGARNASQIVYTNFPLDKVDVNLDVPPLKLTDDDINYFAATDARDGPEPLEKKVAKVLGPVVMLGGVAPGESKANDSAAVATRVQETSSLNSEIPPDWWPYFNEFCVLSVPEKLAPITPELVRASLKRQTQILNFDKAIDNVPDFLVALQMECASFQKHETYAKVTDPRNITTLSEEHFIMFSKYTQPISKYLSTNVDWYIFGKHPDKVAERVHEMTANTKSVVETDFSRFDGTHTHAMYALEEKFMRHCYTEEHYDELTKIYSLVQAVRSRTRYGIYYNPNGTRGSGSADTSLGNSIINGFFNYVNKRKQGLEPKVAYKALGVYGGDDGLTGDANETMNAEAKRANLRLKITTRVPGDFVTVLARVYIEPWISPKHMCDPKRTIARFHVSVKGQHESNIAEMRNRAFGYLVTDLNTAVVSNWSRAVLRCTGDAKRSEVLSYNQLLYKDGCQYGVSFEQSLPIVSTFIDVGVDEIRSYCKLLDDCKTYDEFIAIPPLVKPDPYTMAQIVPGINIGSILQPVLESSRASKPKPLALADYKIMPKLLGNCPLAVDAPLISKYYKTLLRKHSIRRCIDATAGTGLDTGILRGICKCHITACENDIDVFTTCKLNLANLKMCILLHTDSAAFNYRSGDLVLLDPNWSEDRKLLRFNNEDVRVFVRRLVAIGCVVMLRTPLPFVYSDDNVVKPFVVKRSSKRVYKMYTLSDCAG